MDLSVAHPPYWRDSPNDLHRVGGSRPAQECLLIHGHVSAVIAATGTPRMSTVDFTLSASNGFEVDLVRRMPLSLSPVGTLLSS